MSKLLHTTLDDLLSPTDGEREFEPANIIAHVEQHGIHYLDKNNVIRHSQKDDNPEIEDNVIELIGRIIGFENATPVDHYNIEMTLDHSTVQHQTGWLQKPKFKNKPVKSPINISHAKARRSLEHILRTLLLETGRIENINGPIIDGKLKDLGAAIADQGFDDQRDIDTYSDILKDVRILTEQSTKS